MGGTAADRKELLDGCASNVARFCIWGGANELDEHFDDVDDKFDRHRFVDLLKVREILVESVEKGKGMDKIRRGIKPSFVV